MKLNSFLHLIYLQDYKYRSAIQSTNAVLNISFLGTAQVVGISLQTLLVYIYTLFYLKQANICIILYLT